MALLSAAFNVTTRFLKWAVLPVACFLFCFSTAYAAGWVSKTQPDAPDAALCQALLYRLNHTRSGCTATAVAAYPGFKSPPWKTLDASKYIELIAKLAYVASPDWSKFLQEKSPPDWKDVLAGAKTFVREGGTLQIWRTRLLTYFGDGRGTEAPPETRRLHFYLPRPARSRSRVVRPARRFVGVARSWFFRI